MCSCFLCGIGFGGTKETGLKRLRKKLRLGTVRAQ